MNRGIMLRRRASSADHVAARLIGLAPEAILAYVLPTFSGQLATNVMRVEFVRKIIKAMLGTTLPKGSI